MPGLDAAMPVVLVAVALSFALSASAGLGGSLLLVPTLVLVVGPREGVALAALLLAANNVVKVVAYRDTIPLRASLAVAGCTMVGAAAGARLLVALPDTWAIAVVLVALVGSFRADRRGHPPLPGVRAPVLALGAGATSGVSGTSGPLKGVAVRSLGLDRAHTVGAASLVSLAGDATKVAVFSEASLLGADELTFAGLAVPLMVVATFTGRHVNRRIGERGYSVLFWGVIGGYSVRLIVFAW